MFLIQEQLPTSCGRFKPVFATENEIHMKSYCLELDQRVFGLTLTDIRSLAFDMAERYQKSGI